MAGHRADEGKRDHDHHDDRLGIAPELKTQEQEQADQPQHQPADHRDLGGLCFLVLAFDGQRHARVAFEEFRQEPLPRVGDDLVGIGTPHVHVALDRHGTNTIQPVDPGVAAGLLDPGNGCDRHAVAVDGGDRETVKISQAVTIAGRQPNIDLVGFGTDLNLVHGGAEERGPQLFRDGAGVDAQALRPILQTDPHLRLTGAKVVGDVVRADIPS